MEVDRRISKRPCITPNHGGLRRGQTGETLIETLIAIVILGLVAVVAYSGLQTTTRSSAQHKESAIAETLLRTAAEQLQDPTSTYIDYIDRAGCGAGTYTNLPTADGWDPDENGIKVVVKFWEPPTAAAVVAGSVPVDFAEKGMSGDCPTPDPGLQRIELSIVTPSGFTEGLDIVKRRG